MLFSLSKTSLQHTSDPFLLSDPPYTCPRPAHLTLSEQRRRRPASTLSAVRSHLHKHKLWLLHRLALPPEAMSPAESGREPLLSGTAPPLPGHLLLETKPLRSLRRISIIIGLEERAVKQCAGGIKQSDEDCAAVRVGGVDWESGRRKQSRGELAWWD